MVCHENNMYKYIMINWRCTRQSCVCDRGLVGSEVALPCSKPCEGRLLCARSVRASSARASLVRASSARASSVRAGSVRPSLVRATSARASLVRARSWPPIPHPSPPRGARSVVLPIQLALCFSALWQQRCLRHARLKVAAAAPPTLLPRAPEAASRPPTCSHEASKGPRGAPRKP